MSYVLCHSYLSILCLAGVVLLSPNSIGLDSLSLRELRHIGRMYLIMPSGILICNRVYYDFILLHLVLIGVMFSQKHYYNIRR